MRKAYLNTLYKLAEKDRNVLAVISDNGAIVYDEFRKHFPDQFINAGISEQNMIGMAAGLAERGKVPFAYTIGAFLAYRGYEFIMNDVCLMNQNVKLVGIGAGCSYSMLGASHHSIFDIAVLRTLPNLKIFSPASPKEVEWSTKMAYELEGPIYIRLGTNGEKEIYKEKAPFELGKAIRLCDGNDVSLVGTGSIVASLVDVAKELKKDGINARVVNFNTIIPFDKEGIISAIEETNKIVVVEEHHIVGGLGSAVAEVIAEYGKTVKFKRIGVTGFCKGYGSHESVLHANGIGKEDILNTVINFIEDKVHI